MNIMESNNFIDVSSVELSVDDQTRHWFYFRTQPRSNREKWSSIHKTDFGGASTLQDVRVHNGRLEKLTIDEASFELIDCPTSLSTSDFYKMKEADIQTRYYDEIADVVKEKLGCDKVICFHHQVRNQEKAGEEGVEGYAGGTPHTDSSPVSGDQLAIQMAEDNEDKYERYAYINLWRNIAETPIENDHLAMLDERTTVKPDDYIAKDLFGDGYSVVQYNLNARHASRHKWYYFPQMTKNEAIIFKQMDSDYTKSGRISFHMSVKDPTAYANIPPRQSIEVRMMCYWNKTEGGLDTMPTNENTNAFLIKDPEEFARNLAKESSSITGLLQKTPVLKWFVAGSTRKAPVYSGTPSDYLVKFVATINYFPMWPAHAKTWAKGVMKSNGVEKGIFMVTKELVNDTMNYQKTKTFKVNEKKEIVDFLLENEKYMSVARKHLGELA